MKKILGLGLALGLGFSSPAWAANCSYYFNSSIAVPSGYGASWDVFNPGLPQFLSANCNTTPTVPATIGTGALNEAVYGTAYVWTVSTSSWTPITLAGSPVVLNGYFRGQATGNLGISGSDLSSGQNFVAFLVAVFRNGQWVYGCRDVSCASPGWNLQALTTAVVSPTITTVSFPSLIFHTPANPGVTIGTFSVSMSSGSFSGTVALSTASTCAGSPSADNSKFAISGLNLIVGGGVINDTTDHICVSVTDSSASNSPVYQAFTLTGSPDTPVPVSIVLAPASGSWADSSLAGTVISVATVTMSDGTTNYLGTLTSSNPSLVGISGLNIVLARDLITADDGTYSIVITAP